MDLMESQSSVLESRIASTRACFDKDRKLEKQMSPVQARTYDEIGKLIPRGNASSTAVDLGCHWGRYTVLMARTHGKVIGIDFAARALATAKSADNVSYVRLDLNFEAKKLCQFAPVDLFVAIGLMELVADPAGLCRCLGRAARPGSQVFALIPNRRSINYVSFRAALWLARTVLGRKNCYLYNNRLTAPALKKHLQAAGFETGQEGNMAGIPIYLAERLPYSWQRLICNLEPAAKQLLGASYHWLISTKV
jgi:2-polyprenyl-3-methyl-5-hydroxy-6-metoxy-1,4-benzoquinol methylase